MNFELIDNLFQVAILGGASLVGLILGLRHRSRHLLILALGHACFSMGTLYYLLHLAIVGDVPKIFYVAEVSWLAAYLCFLSLQILRAEQLHFHLRPLPALGAAVAAALALIFRMLGPSRLMSLSFALTLGAIAYLSALHLDGRVRGLDALLLVCLALQLLLFIVSVSIGDYTRFNLYFAVDIALTLSLAALLPLTLREVAGR